MDDLNLLIEPGHYVTETQEMFLEVIQISQTSIFFVSSDHCPRVNLDTFCLA